METNLEGANMKPIAIAVLALATMAAVPASAQYYEGPGRYYYEEDNGFGPPRFRRAPRPEPYWESPREYYREERRERFGRRVYGQRLGQVCVTSRGNCETPLVPLESRCRCYIPGFGPKRGFVLY